MEENIHSALVMGAPDWIRESTPTPTFLIRIRLRNKYGFKSGCDWLRIESKWLIK